MCHISESKEGKSKRVFV